MLLTGEGAHLKELKKELGTLQLPAWRPEFQVDEYCCELPYLDCQ